MTTLGPKYIPYNYMEPLGKCPAPHGHLGAGRQEDVDLWRRKLLSSGLGSRV